MNDVIGSVVVQILFFYPAFCRRGDVRSFLAAHSPLGQLLGTGMLHQCASIRFDRRSQEGLMMSALRPESGPRRRPFSAERGQTVWPNKRKRVCIRNNKCMYVVL